MTKKTEACAFFDLCTCRMHKWCKLSIMQLSCFLCDTLQGEAEEETDYLTR